jgi:hypothetical protein
MSNPTKSLMELASEEWADKVKEATDKIDADAEKTAMKNKIVAELLEHETYGALMKRITNELMGPLGGDSEKCYRRALLIDFAKAALTGLLSQQTVEETDDPAAWEKSASSVADDAFRVADAMMNKLDRREKEAQHVEASTD